MKKRVCTLMIVLALGLSLLPGEVQAADADELSCTCETRCTTDQYEENCLVCAADWTACRYQGQRSGYELKSESDLTPELTETGKIEITPTIIISTKNGNVVVMVKNGDDVLVENEDYLIEISGSSNSLSVSVQANPEGKYTFVSSSNNVDATEEQEAMWQTVEGGAWITGSLQSAFANSTNSSSGFDSGDVYDGGTVKLLKDVALTGWIFFKKSVTITSADPDAPCRLYRSSSWTNGTHILVVSAGKTLTLENVIIDGSSEAGITAQGALIGAGSYFSPGDSGHVVLNNGAVLQNNNNTYSSTTLSDTQLGGGVLIYNGSLTMNDGSVIQNCTGPAGGAVAAYTNNSSAKAMTRSFIMNGGTIQNNSATVAKLTFGGGAVYLGAANSSFTMHGGIINKNNSTYWGGAINAASGTTVTINNGEISENSSAGWGGGICSYLATTTLNGGKIANNTGSNGGGVAVSGTTGIVSLSGNIQIVNNKDLNNTANNLYLDGYGSTTSGKIYITGVLSDTSSIGITSGQTPTATTSVGIVSGESYTITAADAEKFFSENFRLSLKTPEIRAKRRI